jgi:hypothetical protein
LVLSDRHHGITQSNNIEDKYCIHEALSSDMAKNIEKATLEKEVATAVKFGFYACAFIQTEDAIDIMDNVLSTVKAFKSPVKISDKLTKAVSAASIVKPCKEAVKLANQFCPNRFPLK